MPRQLNRNLNTSPVRNSTPFLQSPQQNNRNVTPDFENFGHHLNHSLQANLNHSYNDITGYHDNISYHDNIGYHGNGHYSSSITPSTEGDSQCAYYQVQVSHIVTI